MKSIAKLRMNALHNIEVRSGSPKKEVYKLLKTCFWQITFYECF